MEHFSEVQRDYSVKTWEENDIAGRFIIEPVLEEIENSDFLAADITRLNFNVTYEIGYAIGKGKRVVLLRNATQKGDDEMIREVGIFDTLGYVPYYTSSDVVGILRSVNDIRSLKPTSQEPSIQAPIYLVLPRSKADFEVRLVARVKKAGLRFRSFDAEEQGRISAHEAIDNVAVSLGVVAPLLSSSRTESFSHNLRSAFVCGLASGFGQQLLILQQGDDPVPLDYRELVTRITSASRIDPHIGELASKIIALLQAGRKPIVTERRTFLNRLNLGASAAENEMGDLGNYYLETHEYERALRGEAQVVTGRKGSGKTALFFQLRNRLRSHRQKVVLDLKPEGFQLLKFKDVILTQLEQGTKEHTITAFWEYLLLLETCHKILATDRDAHIKNHKLFDVYRALSKQYDEDPFVSEGDFAERILKLTNGIASDFQDYIAQGEWKQRLTSEGC